jgi:PIN domain nuclease of toxin-antitoxin system
VILLDTPILIWLLIAPESLSPKAKKAIRAARKSGPLALSAISLWEIAWLAENKRIIIDVSVDSFVKNALLMCRFSQSLRRLRFVLFNSRNPTRAIRRTELSVLPRLLRAFVF